MTNDCGDNRQNPPRGFLDGPVFGVIGWIKMLLLMIFIFPVISSYRIAMCLPIYIYKVMKSVPMMILNLTHFFKIVLQDIFAWTQSIAFFQLWIVLKCIDTITFFMDPLKWWICLCYAAWIDIQLNTSLSITLKIPKNNVPCFYSNYCLL